MKLEKPRRYLELASGQNPSAEEAVAVLGGATGS
jgi:hypothetical protein